MAKKVEHETGLEENPKVKQRVQHTPEFRKKLQARQDKLDNERGKVRGAPAAATEPKE